jgi:predicted nucleic acid-binding protein
MSEPHGQGGVYLDSNVFIDFMEGEPGVAEIPRRLFEAAKGRADIFVTSEVTLAEALAPSKESGPVPSHIQRQYMHLIAWSRSVRLLPVSRAILYETADLRRYTRHKLVDAIHCVTAIRAGCRFLLSRDRDMSRLPMGVKYVNTDATSVAGLVEALRA